MKTLPNFRNYRMAGLIVVVALAGMAGCGGYKNPIAPAIVKGIVVTPIQPVATSSAAPPQNQATFSASLQYTDGTVRPISSGVQWSYDSAQWVSLSKNIATCTQPAPQIVTDVPSPSQITAIASVDGTSYSASTQLSCF